MADLISLRDQVVKHCGHRPLPGEPAPQATQLERLDPGAPVRVGFGPHCEKGLAAASIDAPEPPPFVEIHPLDLSARVVGYWVRDVGWITPAMRAKADIDVVAWQEAARQLATQG